MTWNIPWFQIYIQLSRPNTPSDSLTSMNALFTNISALGTRSHSLFPSCNNEYVRPMHSITVLPICTLEWNFSPPLKLRHAIRFRSFLSFRPTISCGVLLIICIFAITSGVFIPSFFGYLQPSHYCTYDIASSGSDTTSTKCHVR